MPKTLFFDIGGVVLSNGWDHDQRARAAAKFQLDQHEFNARHERLADPFERGQLSLDAYLTEAVFYVPRAFSASQFREYMFSLSEALSQTVDGVRIDMLDLLAALPYRKAALNNESRELNQHRIAAFGLARHFSAFCSSCYLGERKPGAEIYRRALGIMQAAPADSVFIDDREENLAAPRALGFDCILFHSPAQFQQQLLQRQLL